MSILTPNMYTTNWVVHGFDDRRRERSRRVLELPMLTIKTVKIKLQRGLDNMQPY
jgi:hypothetical protein